MEYFHFDIRMLLFKILEDFLLPKGSGILRSGKIPYLQNDFVFFAGLFYSQPAKRVIISDTINKARNTILSCSALFFIQGVVEILIIVLHLRFCVNPD